MNNATKDGANLIQSLSTLGILDIDAKQLKSAAPNSTRNYQLPDRKVKADELNASDSKIRQTPVLLRPHTQPSLFWKALASTIAPLITNATNLTDEDMALFLSTPTQAGIPGGEFVPREITNFQIFSKADAVQKLDHPGFSLEGASYFSMLASLLNRFFRNLTSDSDSSSINIAREALLRATEAKNKAWKNAFSAYEDKIRNGVDSSPFTEFLNNNVEYSQAWELERQMQAAYTDLQGSDMEVISRQIDILKASDNRLSSSKFGNMPCTVMSDDYIRYALLNRNQTIKVDKETIFYRPLYWLPNWEMHVNHWANSKETSYKYKIDFSHLSEVTWESFGHKGLDTAAAPELTSDQYNLLQQLKGTLTFFGKPVVVDIERGHWDVKGFRHGARLSQRAPEAIKQKFCKTSKFLLSWGFEIEIILPDKVGTKSVEDISLAFLRVPAAVSENGKVLKFTTERTNYPWLMASLASVV